MKASMRHTRRKPSPGFTLLEVLVVLIIIGVLFAIAAPSWTALMNRQRVGTIREQAVQVIREAQNKARLTKVPQAVVFNNDDNGTPIAPRAAIVTRTVNLTTGDIVDFPINDLTTIKNWRTLGEGDVKAGAIDFSTAPPGAKNQLLFDGNGAIEQTSITIGLPFAVKIKPKGTSVEAQRCAIVETLLGSVRLADGTQTTCDS